MTATAGVRNVQRSEKEEGEVKLHVDMKNNVQTYGKCVYELDFRSAIERGLITDFQIVVVAMRGAEWMAHIGEWSKKDLDDFPDMSFDALMGTKEKGNASGKRKRQEDDMKNVPTPMELGQVYALLKLAKDKDVKKLLTFNSTIFDSRRTCTLAEYMSKSLITSSMKHYYVDSAPRTGTSNREELRTGTSNREELKKFGISTTPAMMSNARMLILGYDLPQIQVIGILKPMQNPVDVAQMLGRSLRIDPNDPKKIAYFMLPYFVDETEDAADDAIFFNRQETSELPRPSKRKQKYSWSG